MKNCKEIKYMLHQLNTIITNKLGGHVVYL